MQSFEVSLGYESVDRTTFSTWSAMALHWKCSSVNAFNETSEECIQFLNNNSKWDWTSFITILYKVVPLQFITCIVMAVT
jgi:hypothetical protein